MKFKSLNVKVIIFNNIGINMISRKMQLIITGLLVIFVFTGTAHAQTLEDCIECSECSVLEMWKSMCSFTYQICIIQGLPDDFCLTQKEECEKNIDDLVTECMRICKNSCEETDTCPDSTCATGENCPADASACNDRICYEPTCINGCGEIAVPEGLIDESCNSRAGCISPPCSCDGAGNCVAESESSCKIDISFDRSEYCEGDSIRMIIQLKEDNILTDYDTITSVVHMPTGSDVDVTGRVQKASTGTYTIDGHLGGPGTRTLEVHSQFGSCDEEEEASYNVLSSASPECSGGSPDSCRVDILFDKAYYCPQDNIRITAEFYDGSTRSNPDTFEAILHKPAEDMDITSFFTPASVGTYTVDGTIGNPGQRTLDIGASFPNCDTSTSARFMVYATDSPECTGGSEECTSNADCDDNDPCTTDTCDSSGNCRNTQVTQCRDNDGCCPAGCTSQNDNDCTGGSEECTSNTDCDDNDPCTADSCDSSGNCRNTQVTLCRDNDSCCPAGCTSQNDNDCSETETCSVEVKYDKSIYCDGDSISITAEYKSSGTLKDPQARRVILAGAGPSRDVTNDFIRIREGTYVINSRVGDAGTRTLTLTSTMPDGCSAETESQYNVLSEQNCIECESPSQCDDNDPCTTDNCVDGFCVHDDITSCTSGDGCCPHGCNPTNDNDCTPECSTNAQCNDNNACTIDTCISQMCEHELKTVCEDNDDCCPGGCTKSTDNDCTDTYDVLIVALRNNMDDVYSSTQLASLENKIRNNYVNALQGDGLTARFFYLDEDETSDVIAIKVAKSGTHNADSIDGVLEELIKKLNAKYIIIIGGEDRFLMGTMSGYKSDDFYGNYGEPNGRIDIPVGRILDPNNGDYDQLMAALDAHISMHNSGGLDLSNHVERTLGSNYLTMECFSQYVWGDKCPDNPSCKVGTSDSSTAASGKDFFYLTQHGSPGPPQTYPNALSPGNLNSMDMGGAMWMMVPCHGGVIDYSSASQGITQMFAKRGGSVFFGSTYYNCCANQGTVCTENIDNGGVGALYYRYVRNFAVGKRIGDAYLDGKNDYLSEIGYADRAFINNFYGDPTLKIKNMW